MPIEEVQLNQASVDELSKVGVKEGGAVGNLGFTLSPVGSLVRTPTAISSDTGARQIEKIMEDTNKVLEEKSEDTTSFADKPKPSAEDQMLQNEVDRAKTPEQKVHDDLVARAETAKSSLKVALDPIKAQLEQSKRAQIDSIYSQFTVARNQLIESNRRREDASRTLGIRRGGQYNPTVAAGQLEGVVNQGLQKINELNAEERAAINSVNAAYEQRSLSLALDEYTKLQDIRKEKDKALHELDKELATLNKKMVEERRKQENEISIYNALQSVGSDKLKIFQQLGGKVSSDEIDNFFKDLVPEKTSEDDIFGFSKDNIPRLVAGTNGTGSGLSGDQVSAVQEWMNKYGIEGADEEGNTLKSVLSPAQYKTVLDVTREMPPPMTEKDKLDLEYNRLRNIKLQQDINKEASDKNVPIGEVLTSEKQKTVLRNAILSLSAGQQEGAFASIASFKNGKEMFDLLESGVGTGILSGAMRQGIKLPIPFTEGVQTPSLATLPAGFRLGGVSDEGLTFDSTATSFTSNYIKALSGVQVSDGERQFLMKALPSPYFQEDKNKANIRQLLQFLKNKYELQLGLDFDSFPDEVPTLGSDADLEELFNNL